MDSNDAAAIFTAQELVESQNVREELANITASLSNVPKIIQELKKDVCAHVALKTFIKFMDNLESHSVLREKIVAVVWRNASLSKTSAILRITVPYVP